MSKTQLMTNEEVLLAAGVTADEITAIKSADALVRTNTLDAIYNKLMAFVYEQRVEWANLDNPLRSLEKGYAALNGGSLNGFFQETLIPVRAKGANGLYGGKNYTPKPITSPWDASNIDYGAEPIQYTFGVNTKWERRLTYDRDDLLMNLKDYSLASFIDGKLATIDAEGNASRYAIENATLNNERFQYKKYANCPVFENPSDMLEFMYKVFSSQRFPDTNTEFKKTPFNTTRKARNYVLIIDTNFAYLVANHYQFKQFLKPFVFKSEDSNNYGVEEERTRIIEVDALTPTSSSETAVFDPSNQPAATLPANAKLVARIVDFNAVKFGVGKKSTLNIPLNARTYQYDEIEDYCFDMCDAYVNVPILINTATFNPNRIFYTSSVDANNGGGGNVNT